jgi:hypothetical protein
MESWLLRTLLSTEDVQNLPAPAIGVRCLNNWQPGPYKVLHRPVPVPDFCAWK